MQTGSSGTLIGWKSGQTTFVPLWDRMEGAWLRTQDRHRIRKCLLCLRPSIKIKDDIQNSVYFGFSILTTDGRPASFETSPYSQHLRLTLKFLIKCKQLRAQLIRYFHTCLKIKGNCSN